MTLGTFIKALDQEGILYKYKEEVGIVKVGMAENLHSHSPFSDASELTQHILQRAEENGMRVNSSDPEQVEFQEKPIGRKL